MWLSVLCNTFSLSIVGCRKPRRRNYGEKKQTIEEVRSLKKFLRLRFHRVVGFWWSLRKSCFWFCILKTQPALQPDMSIIFKNVNIVRLRNGSRNRVHGAISCCGPRSSAWLSTWLFSCFLIENKMAASESCDKAIQYWKSPWRTAEIFARVLRRA